MNLYTVKEFGKAIQLGSKYAYQMIPRFLTIWLDFGENAETNKTSIYPKLNAEVARITKDVPVYKVSGDSLPVSKYQC